MAYKYHDSEPLKTPHGNIASDDEGRGALFAGLMMMGIVGMAIGLGGGIFIGWILFSPASFEPSCGTIEQCMVRAEDGQ